MGILSHTDLGTWGIRVPGHQNWGKGELLEIDYNFGLVTLRFVCLSGRGVLCLGLTVVMVFPQN